MKSVSNKSDMLDECFQSLDIHSTYREEDTHDENGVYMKLKELIVAQENQNLSWQNNVYGTSYAKENYSKGKNENWSEGRNNNWPERRNDNWSDGRNENLSEQKHSKEDENPNSPLEKEENTSSPLEHQYNIAQVLELYTFLILCSFLPMS